MNQLSLIDKDLGILYRDAGISRAISHANDLHDGWSERALAFLREYLSTHDRFMCEDLRVASKGIVPEVNGRCWGGIVKRAQALGWIRAVGTDHVDNPTAHRCFATVWERT